LRLPDHGANPKELARSLQNELHEGSLDFSVNVNPFSPLPELREGCGNLYDAILHYPDPACCDFSERAARKEGVKKEQILAGNGAAELIFLVAQAFRGCKVLIVEPAFSEYRDACRANGCDVDYYVAKRENGWRVDLKQLKQKLRGKQLCFFCHPSNPTGVSYDAEEMGTFINLAAGLGVTLVVDEAFLHFMENPVSAVQHLNQYPNLIVLKSLTKMFHLPGVRIGYAIASEENITRLKILQPPWSVNGIAQKLGSLCLAFGEDYSKQVAFKMAKERRRIFPVLRSLGYEPSPSSVNFYVLQKKDRDRDLFPLLRYCFTKGIIVRHTVNFKGLEGKGLRMAIRTPEENDQLLFVLESWGDR
jgi:threonine-phosphate decarboxylase